MKRGRDARTGKFITEKEARANPDTSVVEDTSEEGHIADLERQLAEAQAENTRIRAALANSDHVCPYCSLPADEWAKCKSGFPGCARMDDAMGCPEFGASQNAAQAVEEMAEAIVRLPPSQHGRSAMAEMTPEEKRKAVEATVQEYFGDTLTALAEIVEAIRAEAVAAERAACAEVARECGNFSVDPDSANVIAAAIEARGKR